MAQTTPLAAGLTAANSADIVVAIGAVPASVAIFPNDGVWSAQIQCPVHRKVGSNYQQHYDDNGNPVILTESLSNFTFRQPGTYRVVRPICAESVGVILDQ